MVLSSQKGQFEPYHKLRSMWTLSLKAPNPPVELPTKVEFLINLHQMWVCGFGRRETLAFIFEDFL
jgi:hypothetical protein